MNAGTPWLVMTAAATIVAVVSWAIGRAQGVQVGRARAEWDLRRRARARRPELGPELQPRDREERVRIVRYSEPLWPRTKGTKP